MIYGMRLEIVLLNNSKFEFKFFISFATPGILEDTDSLFLDISLESNGLYNKDKPNISSILIFLGILNNYLFE